MARLRRWSAALAWSSLALASVAHAEAPRPIDLPSGVPIEIPLPGLEQAVSADPSIVKADADAARGVLTLTGVALTRQAVVYAWTASGLTVYVARVVAAELPPVSPQAQALSHDGPGSVFRLTVGGGFRKTPEGSQRLPFSFGGSASRPVASDRLTFRAQARPFAEDNPQATPTGSAVLQWTGKDRRVALGDQPVELGPRLLTPFPLRGLVGEAKVGATTMSLFGGARATPSFTLKPDDHEPLPPLLGGARVLWEVSKELSLSATAAMAERAPVASLAADWRRSGWSLGFEAAAAGERLAAGLFVRREAHRLVLEQRLTQRSSGESPLLSGPDGLLSETVASYTLLPELTLIGRLSVLPPVGRDDVGGGWYVGANWTVTPAVRVAAGLERTFDGSVTTMGGTLDAHSATFGRLSATATRTVSETSTGTVEAWHQAARVEKPLKAGPLTGVFVEETLTHSPTSGVVTLAVGGEVEAGWVRASLAPGVVIPTVTDPNGIAETLRMRVTLTPSPLFQVQVDARQTFGARPDTTVHVSVSPAFGSGAGWGSVGSWFARSTIDGVAFVDQNGNGRHDDDEPGLAGLLVRLDDDRTTTTGAAGRYRFTGVRHGTYRVTLERQNLPPNLRLASASPATVRVPEGSREVSFAFAGTAAIHGVVFNDVRGGGRFTGAEPGVAADLVLEGPGVRRSLSVSGAFIVGGLSPGRYRVTLDPLSLPAAHAVGEPRLEFDLGPGDVVTAQFPVTALRAIAARVCLGGGAGQGCGGGEAPAAGVRVSAGAASATSDAQGRVLLRGLPAGALTLSIDPASLPPGFDAPEPVAVELPEGAATVPITIRLQPARP